MLKIIILFLFVWLWWHFTLKDSDRDVVAWREKNTERLSGSLRLTAS